MERNKVSLRSMLATITTFELPVHTVSASIHEIRAKSEERLFPLSLPDETKKLHHQANHEKRSSTELSECQTPNEHLAGGFFNMTSGTKQKSSHIFTFLGFAENTTKPGLPVVRATVNFVNLKKCCRANPANNILPFLPHSCPPTWLSLREEQE